MKKIKSIFICLAILVNFTSCDAKIKNAKTETVKIWGNCGMCKKTIEAAGYKKNMALVVWNKDIKMAEVTFDSTKTNATEILKRIAGAGYDNEKFTATTKAYNKLHQCCQYERK